MGIAGEREKCKDELLTLQRSKQKRTGAEMTSIWKVKPIWILLKQETVGGSGISRFLLRDAMLVRYMLSSCVCLPAVRLSVTSRYCINWTDRAGFWHGSFL